MLSLLLEPFTHTGAAHPAGSISAALIAIMLGLLIGSFLNVVIHRLPLMMQREADNYLADEAGHNGPHRGRYNLLTPRSACPQCGTPVAPAHNIPLLGYLLLQGRCAH